MKASFDGILYEMDKFISKPATQIKCIKMLYPILKSQNSLQPLNEALDRVNNALNEIKDSYDLYATCVAFFGKLIDNPTLYSLLGGTDISKLIIYILYMNADDKVISYDVLDQITKVIRIPKLLTTFNDKKFIQCLVYISRSNPKSFDHASAIVQISQYLDKSENNMKDLLGAFLLFSRSFSKNERFQEEILRVFLILMDKKSIKDVGGAAVAQFSDICCIFNKNITILSDTIIILNKSGEQIPADLLDIILNEQDMILDNQTSLPFLMEIFATKLTQKDTPPIIFAFAQCALEFFMSAPIVCKNALRVAYNCLCTSNSQDKEVCVKMTTLLTSVILYYEFSASIVKQASVILHQLTKMPFVCDRIAITAAPHVLASFLLKHASDQKTVSIICTVLDNIVSKSTIAAGHLSSTGSIAPKLRHNDEVVTSGPRVEDVDSLKRIINEFSEDDTIVKHMLSILYSIALSSYEVQEFVELPVQRKKPFFIESEICNNIVMNHLDDINFVKPAVMFAEPSENNSSFINAAMKRYNGDADIQICCLSTGLAKVSNITSALSVCEENALRFALPILKKSEEKLSPQLIEFLLSCDRNDVVDIILDDIDRGNQTEIASLFDLCFPQQLPIAKKLSELKLWNPTEDDENLIMTVLSHSVFDKRLFESSLYFACNYKVNENSILTLLDAIKNYPKDVSIVLPCAKFISSMNTSNYLENALNKSSAVGLTAISLKFFADEKEAEKEECCYYLLKMAHIISFFESLQSQFVSSMIIPLIIKASDNSSRCKKEANMILSNIVDDDIIAKQIYDNKGYKSAFEDFNQNCYQLVATLIEKSMLELDEKQFQIVYKHFSSLKANQLGEDSALQLISIIESYAISNEKVSKLDVKKFVLILNVFTRNKEIIEKTLHIIPKAKEFNLNEQLLFALLEIIKNNMDDQSVIREACQVLQSFSKVEMHKNVTSANSTIDLFIAVLDKYAKDPCICSTIFLFLKESDQAIEQILKAISLHNEKEIVLSISKCILSIAQENYLSPTILVKILQVLKANQKSKDICICLIQSAYLASDTEECIPILLNNVNLLADICVRHISSVEVPRAVLGIIYKIVDKTKAQLNIAGPIVSLCLKMWSSDEQVMITSLYIIINLSQEGKSRIFKHSIVPILNAFKNQRAQQQQKGSERTLTICNAICALKSVIKEYEDLVSSELIKYFFRLASEGKDDQEDIVLNTILEISDEIQLEAAIFQNCKSIFDIAVNAETNEIITAHLFELLSLVNDRQLIQRYDSFIPNLIQIMKSDTKFSSVAAAQLLEVMATLRPDLVDPYSSNIISDDKRSSRSEIHRCISSIREKIN